MPSKTQTNSNQLKPTQTNPEYEKLSPSPSSYQSIVRREGKKRQDCEARRAFK